MKRTHGPLCDNDSRRKRYIFFIFGYRSQQIYKVATLRWVVHLLRKDNVEIIKKVLNSQSTEKRKRGKSNTRLDGGCAPGMRNWRIATLDHGNGGNSLRRPNFRNEFSSH